MVIQDGRIDQIGPATRIDNLISARGARVIEAEGRVVMPGFVDSHTHLVCGPPRLDDYEKRIGGASYQQIAAEGGGIQWTMNAVRKTRAADLEVQARRTLSHMARCGTTTVEAKSGYGYDARAELRLLSVAAALRDGDVEVVPTYLGAHVVPPNFKGTPDEFVDTVGKRFVPRVASLGVARFADVYCDVGAFTLQQARRYLLEAKASGFQLKVHANQFSNIGAVQLATALGAFSADHLEHAGEAEIRALAESDTVATLLPGSVFHLGLTKYAPARALIEGGAAVALATDFNPGSSPTWSMPMILSLACTQMRMTPAEAIVAATFNGACALGMQAKIGSLEVGKWADFLMLEVPDYREIPYHFGGNLVAMTVKRGRTIARQMESE
jgi:imidazolonepropionase